MFPSRKFHTRIPVGVIPHQLDFLELYQRDLEKKMQMKGYADNKKVVKTSDIQKGETVLVKQDARSKATPPFEEESLKVPYRKGSQVVAKRKEGWQYHNEDNSTLQKGNLPVQWRNRKIYTSRSN